MSDSRMRLKGAGRWTLIVAGWPAAALLALGLLAQAEPPKAGDKPVPTRPAPKEGAGGGMNQAKISAEAQKLLSQMQATLDGVKTLKIAGSKKTETKLPGNRVQKETFDFTIIYKAPNKFRYEAGAATIDDDGRQRQLPNGHSVGCTGTAYFAHLKAGDIYYQSPANASKIPAQWSREEHGVAVRMVYQAPLLTMLAFDRGVVMMLLHEGANEVSLKPRVMLGAHQCDVLRVTTRSGGEVIIYVGADDHLPREIAHVREPSTATIETITQNIVAQDVELQDSDFDWRPPAKARAVGR